MLLAEVEAVDHRESTVRSLAESGEMALADGV